MFNGGSWTRPFSSLPCAEHLFAISEIFTAFARVWMPQSRFYQHERLISSSDPNISIWTNELPVAVGLQLCGWICCKRCNCRVLADKFPCHSMWKPWGISPIGNDIALDRERERGEREREICNYSPGWEQEKVVCAVVLLLASFLLSLEHCSRKQNCIR